MREPIGSIPLEMSADGIETRGTTWGKMSVRSVDLPPGVDFTPLLAGLPGDMCQCPHWGYMVRGSMHLRYADGTEEDVAAGETYYWPAGHTGWSGPDGATFVEISSAEEIAPVLAHIAEKMGG